MKGSVHKDILQNEFNEFTVKIIDFSKFAITFKKA